MADVNCTRCRCGAQIPRSFGPGRPRKYCAQCAPAKVVARKPRLEPQAPSERPCATCAVLISGDPRRIYCSSRCRESARKQRDGRECDVCGEATWSYVGEASRHKACVPLEHGTRTGYLRRKCRCMLCRQWNREVNREYRAKRIAEGRPIINSGWSGPWINPGLRRSIFERDGWICQLCFEPVNKDAEPNADWYPSLDHITPQSAGGKHTADNLRTAHRWCNSIRGANDYHSDLFYASSGSDHA